MYPLLLKSWFDSHYCQYSIVWCLLAKLLWVGPMIKGIIFLNNLGIILVITFYNTLQRTMGWNWVIKENFLHSRMTVRST